MRKQFNLQDWLKDKSQKVETRDGRPARIICTDAKADDGACIIALIPGYGGEEAYQFFPDGRAFSSKSSDEDCADLFLVTPEPELTEWQRFISACLQKNGLLDCNAADRIAKESAAELLSLAREQFIKDGYVIEKKAFHDAVEKIDDKHKAEMRIEYSLHCKIKNGTRHAIMNWDTFQKVAQKFIDLGKAEALKDLPRWNPSNCPRSNLPSLYLTGDGTALYKDGYEISISGLEKLPKEETNL